MPKKSSENTCYKRDFTLVSFDQQLFGGSSIHPMVNTTVKIHLSVVRKGRKYIREYLVTQLWPRLTYSGRVG